MTPTQFTKQSHPSKSAAPLMDNHGKSSGQEIKWTKTLIFASLGSTVGSAVSAGYCVGVMNSPAVHMRAWCQATLIASYDWHLSAAGVELLWSAIVSIFLVGGAIGSLSGAAAANRFGRRGCFYICGAMMAFSAAGFFCCRLLHSVELLILARFVMGLASGLTTAFLPMYHSELAALEQRSTLAPLCAMGLTAGVVIAQIFSLQSVLGDAENWHVALSFYFVFVLISYAPYRLYPESPKWLYIVKARREQAQRQLEKLRGFAADAELNDMAKEDVSAQGAASSFAKVLSDKRLRLPLIIVCVYQGGQQFSGINAIFFYSVSIFVRAGFSRESAEWMNLALGSLNLLSSLLSPMLMTRINRRPLMLCSSFFCMLFLFLFSIMLNFVDSVGWFAQGCIPCIFLYIFFFQLGVGPIPFFIGSELFEVSPRPVAMSMGSLSSWTSNFIIAMCFPSLQNTWGALVFLPFSFTCLLIFLLTKRYLPETRGRDASAVAPLVANGFKSKPL